MSPSNSDQATPVVLIHWNRPRECLKSVDAFQAQDVSLRISIVDNGSDQKELDTLRSQLPAGVDLIPLGENKGWGGAANHFLRAWLGSKSECCFIAPHDALPGPGCLRLLLHSMSDPSNRIGIACAELGTSHLPAFSPVRGPRLLPVFPRQYGTVEPVVYPHGTLLLVRRQCLLDIGLFDERYFAYGDEIELGLRARRQGWIASIAWGARVLNPGTWSSSRLRSYLFTRNSLLLARDYGGNIHAALRACLIVPNTLRLCVCSSARGSAFSISARALAIQDFFRGRFGMPPHCLFQQ